MTDLYSILAKAIDALEPNTNEARRRLYERARAALVAETHRLAQSESEFLAVLGSLEEAIQKIEAEVEERASRDRRIQPPAGPTPTALPRNDIPAAAARRGDIGAVSRRPAKPMSPQRSAQFMPFFARAFRLSRDGARNLLQRAANRSERQPGNHSNEMNFDPPPDNWLSELLARASRAEHESGDGAPVPRRDVRRRR